MYTDYFNIKEKPFKLTPDPKYLYLSENHNKTLTTIAELLYAVKEEVGFAVVTGEVGTGKTTICRIFVNYINRFKDKYRIAYIYNPNVDDLELHQTINRELGLKHDSASRNELHHILADFLLAEKKEGRSVILLIDEAQNLSPSTLEQIRLISNLETETQKLIQIILVGQPELSAMLGSKSLRQLNQRISVRCYLTPLSFRDMVGYIRHRLSVAGGKHLMKMFTWPSLAYIYLVTRGVPRLTNIICDRALLAACSLNSMRISLWLTKRCVNETSRFRPTPKYMRFLAPALVFVLGIFISTQLLFADLAATVASANIIVPSVVKKSAENGSISMREIVSRKGIKRLFDENSKVEAVNAVLNAWRVKNSVSGAEEPDSFAKIAEKRNFKCYGSEFSLPSLLETDYPAIIEVKNSEGETGFVPVLGTLGERIAVDPEGRRSLSRRWVEKNWKSGKAWIFWQDFHKMPDTIKKGDRGKPVVWLQESLEKLGYLGSAPKGRFEDNTADAVYRFQSDNRIKTSGILDPLTKLYLYKQLGDHKIPRIS
jgi:general secretion pathway protein A